jgi:hypothetical protein
VLSRRGMLLGVAGAAGAAGVTAAGVAGTVGVVEGVLPGRPRLQAALGLNGDPGRVPGVAPTGAGCFRTSWRSSGRE